MNGMLTATGIVAAVHSNLPARQDSLLFQIKHTELMSFWGCCSGEKGSVSDKAERRCAERPVIARRSRRFFTICCTACAVRPNGAQEKSPRRNGLLRALPGDERRKTAVQPQGRIFRRCHPSPPCVRRARKGGYAGATGAERCAAVIAREGAEVSLSLSLSPSHVASIAAKIISKSGML